MVRKIVQKNVEASALEVTPAITLSGKEVDQVFADLTSPLLFQRQPNGALAPLIEPGVQRAILLIQKKAQEAKGT